MEKKRFIPPKKKPCPFCQAGMKEIDYKDVDLLRKFISPETGKIESRRRTGACAKHQRFLSRAIKKARFLALLPYTAEHIRRTGGVGTINEGQKTPS